MGGKAKTPKAPNYTAIAQQQAASQQQLVEQQAAMNRVGQVTPYADMSWSRDPISGQWFQTTNFSPEQQAQYDQLNNITQNYLNNYNPYQIQAANLNQAPGMPTAVDYSQLGAMPQAVDYMAKLGAMPQAVDYAAQLGAMPQVGGYNQQVIDTINQLQAPELQRQRAAKEAQMAAMGLSMGTGNAWNTEQGTLSDAENKARLNAIMQGIQQGNVEYGQALQGRAQRAGELGQTFAQQMQGRQLGGQELANQFMQQMQARQQGAGELERGFTQQMGLHTQGVQDLLNQQQAYQSANQANLSQLQGLYGLGNQQMARLQMPGVPAVGMGQAADLTGAAQQQYNAALDKANAQNAQKAGTLQTIGTVAGAAFGMPMVGSALGGMAGNAIYGGGYGGGSPSIGATLGNAALGYGAQALGNSGMYNLGSGYAGNVYAGTQGYQPLDYSTYNSMGGYYD